MLKTGGTVARENFFPDFRHFPNPLPIYSKFLSHKNPFPTKISLHQNPHFPQRLYFPIKNLPAGYTNLRKFQGHPLFLRKTTFQKNFSRKFCIFFKLTGYTNFVRFRKGGYLYFEKGTTCRKNISTIFFCLPELFIR